MSGFGSSFWEIDYVTQSGFDSLVAHMKNGRNSCKEYEEYLKQRAKIEETYANALLKLAKVERGSSEYGTLKNSFENFRIQCEAEANARILFHTKVMEEANKITQFREKQKEEARSREDLLKRSHKTKADHFRKLTSNRSSYESKCKQYDKASVDFERIQYSTKPKEVEKAKKHMTSCQGNMEKADTEYKHSVASLEASRIQWIDDHKQTCEAYEELEIERFKYLQNAFWVFSNLLSDICVQTDNCCEENRLMLEQIDIDSDIHAFVKDKGKPCQPLEKISYVAYGDAIPSSPNLDISGSGQYSAITGDSAYSSLNFGDRRNSNAVQYIVKYDYDSRNPQEMKLRVGDRINEAIRHDDGWSEGVNLTSGEKGLFPTEYITVA